MGLNYDKVVCKPPDWSNTAACWSQVHKHAIRWLPAQNDSYTLGMISVMGHGTMDANNIFTCAGASHGGTSGVGLGAKQGETQGRR